MRRFDSSYADEDKEVRARRGRIWSIEEEQRLTYLFRTGTNLVSMSVQMQRPAAGVMARLCKLGLLKQDTLDPRVYYYAEKPTMNNDEVSTTKFISPKEPTMSTPIIETRILIQGRNAAEMSDAQIFGLIGELEGKIKKLEGIEAKPKKLVAAIDTLKADIAKLVEYVDSRE